MVVKMCRTKEVRESFNSRVSGVSWVHEECKFVFTTNIGEIEKRKRLDQDWDDLLEILSFEVQVKHKVEV